MNTRILVSNSQKPLPFLPSPWGSKTQSPQDVLSPAAWVICCQGSEGVVGSDGNKGGFDRLFKELPNYPAYQFVGSFPLLFPLINQNSFCCYWALGSLILLPTSLQSYSVTMRLNGREGRRLTSVSSVRQHLHSLGHRALCRVTEGASCRPGHWPRPGGDVVVSAACIRSSRGAWLGSDFKRTQSSSLQTTAVVSAQSHELRRVFNEWKNTEWRTIFHDTWKLC